MGMQARGHAAGEMTTGFAGGPAAERVTGRGRPRAVLGMDATRLARALGWFSLGLGLAEVVMPRVVARAAGVRGATPSRVVLRLAGLREIAAGVGIFSQPRAAGWLWARVAGDAMDLALLGAAFLTPRARRGRTTAATLAVIGVTAADVLCAGELGRADGVPGRRPRHHAVATRGSITIKRSPEELYRAWRDLPGLPRFMPTLESVERTGERRSHWRARGPAGTTVEWDAEIVDDRPDELIAWRAVGGQVAHAGLVRFQPAPAGRGTQVTVEMEYTPPAGAAGAKLAQLFGAAPGQRLREDLRRFKQLMETGEILLSEGVIGDAAQPLGAPDAGRTAAAGGRR